MDTEQIKTWIELAAQNGLTFLGIEEEDWGIEVRLPPRGMPLPTATATHSAAPAAESSATYGGQKSEPAWIEIKSFWVGYFRNPSEKFSAGAIVEPDEVLGEVETLGLSNPIVVPAAGSLREVLVSDGDPVQYGQVVAILEPR
jgi:acetyl-CoA carboxylase biotin carboxyl carrier protein